MRKRVEVSLAATMIGALLAVNSVAVAAPADLSGWVGVANTAGANNFTSTATTAGGQFQARFNDGLGTLPSLADDSLTGGPFGFDDALTLTGTIQFDEPEMDVDPSLQFGWFDSTGPLTRRISLNPADTQSAGDFRWVLIVAGNAGTGVNVLSNGATTSIPEGSHSLSLSYSPGDGTVTATIGEFTATLPNFSTDQDVFDRFGFSFGDTVSADNPTTYALQVSNINYTGESTVSATPGDFDADGDVDGADFVAWQTHFPTASGAMLSDGDADADGDVDGADFVIWQTNFPFTSGPGVTPIPEPCSLLMAAMCAGLCAAYRWQQH